MIIQKEYKFYAAHRNEELTDKCRNLHGHRYGVTCFFEVRTDRRDYDVVRGLRSRRSNRFSSRSTTTGC